MGWYRRVVNVVFRSRRLSADIESEFRFHIAERTDDLIAAGLSPDEARRQAERQFGNYTLRREETGDMDLMRILQAAAGDLRYGARQLRASPGFAVVAVLSLALGIGANSAIFQLINALGLRALPVEAPEHLAVVDAAPDFFSAGWSQGRHRVFTFAQFEAILERQQAFSGLMAFGTTRFNLSQGGDVRYAEAIFVTPNFLDVLGVRPAIGGWLPADADPRDCSGAGALLGDSFWHREYGGDPGVVGRTISLNGRALPILGVAAARFFGVEPGRRFDVAVPLCVDGLLADDGQGRLANDTAWWLTPIGRLAPGWTVDRASTHFRDISPAIFQATLPPSYRADIQGAYLNNRFRVVPGRTGVSDLRQEYGTSLWILLASTAFVLMIACANLANLLLARGSTRGREIALRLALGASRLRIAGQLLCESLLLGVLGAAVGVWLAHVLSRAIVAFLTGRAEPIDVQLGLDWRVIAFTAGLALVTTMVFGLVPALRAARRAPVDAMRGGRGAASSAEHHGLRRVLLVAQIALSFVLLVGALLLGRSLGNLMTADTGMTTGQVLVAEIRAGTTARDPERRRVVFAQLEDAIAQLPSVTSASTVLFSPFSGIRWVDTGVHADTDPSAQAGSIRYMFNRVGPGYFQTMGVPILAGRDFTPGDDKRAPLVAIVNERFARDLFGRRDVVGRTFRKDGDTGVADQVFRIVGIVGNTKYDDLREPEAPIAFLPVAQDDDSPATLNFVMRAGAPFADVLAGVKARMREIDPSLLVDAQPLDLQIAQSVVLERLVAALSEGFGVLALLLSMLGLYGVLSYMVACRRREIGVRMALGAKPSSIRRMVGAEVGRLLAIGLALGLAGAIGLSRYLEAILFELKATDAVTLGLGCVVLAATAVAAAWIPMRRATTVNPAIVLEGD